MSARSGAALRPMRFLQEFGSVNDLTDGQLLDRFHAREDDLSEWAFTVLVERHGPMVLRVCMRVLADSHAAQDAFQATFLVLARRAGSIRHRESIAGWLFGVSSRVAARVRSSTARRRGHERRYGELSARREDEAPVDTELIARLHREIAGLPERFRVVLVLCDLEGLTHEQAAIRLGCPAGTVKSRLARGRVRLRDRLHGSHAVVIPTWQGSRLIVSPVLARTTTAHALQAVVGGLQDPAVSAPVLSLANGVLGMMKVDLLRRWVMAAAIGATLVGSGIAGAGMLADLPTQDPPNSPLAQISPAENASALPVAAGSVAYEITFLETPGLTWRRLGHSFDFALEPLDGISFLSNLEADLILKSVGALPESRVLRAPRVTSSAREVAQVTRDEDGRAVAVVEPRPFVGRVEPQGAPETVSLGGCSVRLRGDPLPDARSISVDFSIRDQHVVEVHAGVGPDGRRIEVPEVVRKNLEKKVTLPSGGTFLVGLGISRTSVANAPPRISEQFVMVRVTRPDTPAAAVNSGAVPPPR